MNGEDRGLATTEDSSRMIASFCSVKGDDGAMKIHGVRIAVSIICLFSKLSGINGKRGWGVLLLAFVGLLDSDGVKFISFP